MYIKATVLGSFIAHSCWEELLFFAPNSSLLEALYTLSTCKITSAF